MNNYKIEELEVFNLAMNLGEKTWALVVEWNYFTKNTLGMQLVRASDSIAANIAEGYGRYSFKENRNFCFISRGSLLETKAWLQKVYNRKLLEETQYNMLMDEINTIHLKLNAYIKYINKNISNQRQ